MVAEKNGLIHLAKQCLADIFAEKFYMPKPAHVIYG
jgi:hypothetical protein